MEEYNKWLSTQKPELWTVDPSRAPKEIKTDSIPTKITAQLLKK